MRHYVVSAAPKPVRPSKSSSERTEELERKSPNGFGFTQALHKGRNREKAEKKLTEDARNRRVPEVVVIDDRIYHSRCEKEVWFIAIDKVNDVGVARFWCNHCLESAHLVVGRREEMEPAREALVANWSDRKRSR